MIDEELYQQAADELISDRRRPHIWARACALASDDHDEARYLYTNLRVEELIAEREAGGSVPPGSVIGSSDDNDSTLALEPVPLDPEDPANKKMGFLDNDEYKFDEIDDIDDIDDIPSSVSTPAGVDAPNSDNSADEFFQLLAGEEEDADSILDATAEMNGADVIDLDSDELAEFQASIPAEEFESFDSQAATDIEGVFTDSTVYDPPDQDAPPQHEALQQNNDQLDTLLGGVYAPGEGADDPAHEDAEDVLTADFSDATATGTQAVLPEDELEWLDDKVAPDDVKQQLESYQPESLERDHTDRLTMELERQADEMPGQHSDVVAHEVPVQPDISPAATAADQPEYESAYDSEFEPVQDTQPDHAAAAFTAAGAGAAATAAIAGSRGSDNLDLSAPHAVSIADQDTNQEQKTGKHYSVYRRNQSLQAVKNGVSWSALIATLPFMIYRHLFGTAIMYIIMSIILLAGLLITGLTWFDAGVQATPLIKGATIGFGVLAAVGLLYMPFRHGNAWRSEKLENRGYDLVATVRAKNPGKAIAQARRAVALGS